MIEISREELDKMLVDAFNQGYQTGLGCIGNRIIGADLSPTGDNELIYKINGKDYKQMTIGDLYD